MQIFVIITKPRKLGIEINSLIYLSTFLPLKATAAAAVARAYSFIHLPWYYSRPTNKPSWSTLRNCLSNKFILTREIVNLNLFFGAISRVTISRTTSRVHRYDTNPTHGLHPQPPPQPRASFRVLWTFT